MQMACISNKVGGKIVVLPMSCIILILDSPHNPCMHTLASCAELARTEKLLNSVEEY